MTEKFKPGKPTHDGWWRYKNRNNEGWCAAYVEKFKDGKLKFYFVDTVHPFECKFWDLVDETIENQWAGEIEMPKDDDLCRKPRLNI